VMIRVAVTDDKAYFFSRLTAGEYELTCRKTVSNPSHSSLSCDHSDNNEIEFTMILSWRGRTE